MPYTALPDRRMPYDVDGTIVGYSGNYADYNTYNGQGEAVRAGGIVGYLDSNARIEWNDYDATSLGLASNNSLRGAWMFFPESREVTAMVVMTGNAVGSYGYGPSYFGGGIQALRASVDSTNGVDGTWEAPTVTGGVIAVPYGIDKWRSTIASLSFTGTKKVIWFVWANQNTYAAFDPCLVHVFGEKGAGQTPDDVIFINHDDTPGVEFTAPEDFGDKPLGTTTVRQFRLKNVSPTKTANTINIQCNDSDYAISEDGSTWVVTINLTSLASGAESATLYVRCTTPAPGAALGPRAARIVVTVASYT